MPLTKKSSKRTLSDIAALVGGNITGDQNVVISGACGLEEATAGDISYITAEKYTPLLKKTKAAAIIAPPNIPVDDRPSLVVDNPSKAFLRILLMWQEEPCASFSSGIDSTSCISSSASIGSDVHIGPGVVVGDNAVIGDRSVVLANSVIDSHVKIGKGVLIHQNVTVTAESSIEDNVILHSGVVIGADGFGYEWLDDRYVKVPQTGSVLIQKDVEVGANTCIDRARFGQTVIGEGTKIDNLVQIAHNVTIGKHCLIISQVGIAGSSKIGDYAILAGQVGVVGHVEVGARSKIGAQSGIHKSVPDDSVLLGSPPRPIREAKELMILNSRLPQLFKDIKQIKKKLDTADS